MGARGAKPKPTALKVLHDDARAARDRLALGLIAVGVLTSWDVDVFAIVCEALARYKQATKLVNGFVKNPALIVQHEAETTFAQYGARPAGWSRRSSGGTTRPQRRSARRVRRPPHRPRCPQPAGSAPRPRATVEVNQRTRSDAAPRAHQLNRNES